MASPSAKAQPGRRAGTDAESRANRFMRSALGILGETGRTDFTVLEVVERSKTSLRAFYQHFATKDELLLALVERIMTDASERWRAETAGGPITRLVSGDAALAFEGGNVVLEERSRRPVV